MFRKDSYFDSAFNTFRLSTVSVGLDLESHGLSFNSNYRAENIKRNLSEAVHLSQRHADQLQFMDKENSQLRQGLVSFLQRFAIVETQTAEMSQGMRSLTTRLQSGQSEVNQLATKSETRIG